MSTVMVKGRCEKARRFGFFICLFVALGWGGGMPGGGEVYAATELDEPAAKDSLSESFTLVDLLAKAEAIVVAEVGEQQERGTPLKVLVSLKNPTGNFGIQWGESTSAPRQKLASEVYKRAEERLDEETARKDRDASKEGTEELVNTNSVVAGGPLYVVVENLKKLPRPGVQALFFLWERVKADGPEKLRYRVNHPQCVYDKAYAATVQAALNNRRMALQQTYLRAWDRERALRIERQRQSDAIKKMEAGHVERGMRMSVLSAKTSLRGDNSLFVGAQFENARAYPQFIYDGLLADYGIRLRKKGEGLESALVIRAPVGRSASGLDRDILALSDAADFAMVKKEGVHTKDLHFNAKEFPVLTTLDGAYILNVFYSSKEDGKNVELLDAEAWTGTLISADIECQFKRP